MNEYPSVAQSLGTIGAVFGGIVGYQNSTKHKFWGTVIGIIAGSAVLSSIGYIGQNIYRGIKNPVIKQEDK